MRDPEGLNITLEKPRAESPDVLSPLSRIVRGLPNVSDSTIMLTILEHLYAHEPQTPT
jgi:hypothetical protein